MFSFSTQNTTRFSFMQFAGTSRKSLTMLHAVCVASPLGYLNRPVDSAGNAMVRKPLSAANLRLFAKHSVNWSSSGRLGNALPVRHGPTAWMMCLAGKSNPSVITTSPTAHGAFAAHACSKYQEPAAANTAAHTPVPLSSLLFAALTITSTSKDVMSPSNSETCSLITMTIGFSGGMGTEWP